MSKQAKSRRHFPRVSERQIHIAVADYLRAKSVWFYHSPSEFFINKQKDSRFFAMIVSMKMMGWVPSFPDIIIFDPPPKVLAAPGAVLELKSKGKVPSANQMALLMRFGRAHWAWSWSDSEDEALEQLKGWGYY